VVYVGSLFAPGLQDDADSSHAEAAREMSVTRDFVTLKINGNRYLEKAPLMYWAVTICYWCFGVNEFAAHLPIALSILLLILLAIRWGRRAFGERSAIYAGLFLATAAGCYLFTRILIPESILSFFIAAAFYFLATALEDGRAWRWYAGYSCIALAVLTKGLLSLVVVGGGAILYLAISGEWRRWREFRLATGIPLFFLVAAPWHILAGIRNPHFFLVLFCKRTLHALPWQAHSQRLQQADGFSLLDVAPGVALSLEHLFAGSAAGADRGLDSPAQAGRADSISANVSH